MGSYGSGRQGGYPTDGATNSVVLDIADFKGLTEGLYGAGTITYRCAQRGEKAKIRLDSAFLAGAERILARLPKRKGLLTALVGLAMLAVADAKAETLPCGVAEKPTIAERLS